MRHRKFLFIMLFNLIFAQTAVAQKSLQHLDSLLNQYQSLQAHFIQIVKDEKNFVLQRTEGDLYIQRPGKFRWEINKPFTQVLISDGEKLWNYEEDLMQVIIKPLNEQIKNTPAMILVSSQANINNYFVVKRIKQTESETVFKLIPKTDSSDMFSSVEIGFKQNKLNTMQLIDHFGHTSVLEFSNVIINPKLQRAKFLFKPSKGVDVVDTTT